MLLDIIFFSKFLFNYHVIILIILHVIYVIDDMICGEGMDGLEFCPNLCGRSYRGRYRTKNIKRHLRYECGVQPQFQCDVCLKRFTHNSDRKKHMVIIHKALLESNLPPS